MIFSHSFFQFIYFFTKNKIKAIRSKIKPRNEPTIKQRMQNIKLVTVLNGILSLSVIYPELMRIITPKRIARRPPITLLRNPPTLTRGFPIIPRTPSTIHNTPAMRAKTFLISEDFFPIKRVNENRFK